MCENKHVGSAYRPTKIGLATQRRHTSLVAGVHQAIEMLEAPFTPSDYIPGNIEDAIEILRGALGQPQRERQDD